MKLARFLLNVAAGAAMGGYRNVHRGRDARRMSALVPDLSAARLTFAVLVLLGTAVPADLASAQRLGDRILGTKPETLPRRPNDQVEGRIWEYVSTEYKMTIAPGEPIPKLSGRFRIEGTAVFDANRKVAIKPRSERGETLERLVRGEGAVLSIPAGSEEKRIGEYRKLSNGKLRFDFNDPEGLHGIMIAWKKKDSNGVWLANYTQREGKKTTGQWLMELRVIED